MSYYAVNVLGQASRRAQTTNPLTFGERIVPVKFVWTDAMAVAADTDGVHAATTSLNSGPTTWTTAITNPAAARNITATSAGTAGDIAAVQVTINGTNWLDEVITEDLPVFTENTGTTVEGALAFKTVTSVVIPSMDGAGASVAIGWGDELGMPYILDHADLIQYTFFGGTLESTPPTLTHDATDIEANTLLLDSTLDGSAARIGRVPERSRWPSV